MRCATCQAENPSEGAYCANCGAPLRPPTHAGCPRCSWPNPVEAAFCGSCDRPLTPQSSGLGGPGGPGPDSALPPRDLGQLVNETFRVYRANWVTFFAIALLPDALSLISSLAGAAVSIPHAVLAVLFTVSVIAQGAVAVGVARYYSGRKVKFGTCIGSALRSWLTLIVVGIVVLLVLAASAALVIILVGVPLFFYLLVKLFFAPQAVMLEGKGAMGSLSRSMELVSGNFWRVLGIGVVYVLIGVLFALVAFIPAAMAGLISEEASTVVLALLGAVFLPFTLVGTTLVYLDLRVRREGFTVEQLAERFPEDEDREF